MKWAERRKCTKRRQRTNVSLPISRRRRLRFFQRHLNLLPCDAVSFLWWWHPKKPLNLMRRQRSLGMYDVGMRDQKRCRRWRLPSRRKRRDVRSDDFSYQHQPTDHSLTNTVATVENRPVTTMVLQTLFSAHDGVRVLFARSRDDALPPLSISILLIDVVGHPLSHVAHNILQQFG